LDHPEHVVGQVEQADAVRDTRLRAPDALRDVAERKLELVEEDGVRARLLDRRQLLARNVLDQSDQERVAIVRLADDGGNGRHPGVASRPPAALTGDDLVPARSARAHDQRLDHALALDRLRKSRPGLAVALAPRLPRVRMDRADRQLEQLRRARFEPGDELLDTT